MQELSVPTGTTGDIGDVIQTAVDALEPNRSDTLILPAGLYEYSDTIELDHSGIRLEGSGNPAYHTSFEDEGGTVLKYTGTGNAIEIGSTQQLPSLHSIELKGFKVVRTDNNNAGHCIHVKDRLRTKGGCIMPRFTNMEAFGGGSNYGDTGFYLGSLNYGARFQNCFATLCYRGFDLYGANHHTIMDYTKAAYCRYGCVIDRGELNTAHHVMTNSDYEVCALIGIHVCSGRMIEIRQGYYEGHTSATFINSPIIQVGEPGSSATPSMVSLMGGYIGRQQCQKIIRLCRVSGATVDGYYCGTTPEIPLVYDEDAAGTSGCYVRGIRKGSNYLSSNGRFINKEGNIVPWNKNHP